MLRRKGDPTGAKADPSGRCRSDWRDAEVQLQTPDKLQARGRCVDLLALQVPSVISMNKSQRIVLVLCCIAVAYCCLWIPWRSPVEYTTGTNEQATAGAGLDLIGQHRLCTILLKEARLAGRLQGRTMPRPTAPTAVPDLAKRSPALKCQAKQASGD